jgi:hypothetical protein
MMKRKSKAEALLENSLRRRRLILETNRLHLGGQADSLDLDLHRAALDTDLARLDGPSTDRTILLDRPPVIPKNSFVCDTDCNPFGYGKGLCFQAIFA